MAFVFNLGDDPADYHGNNELHPTYVHYKMYRQHPNYKELGSYLDKGGKIITMLPTMAVAVADTEDLLHYNENGSRLTLKHGRDFMRSESPAMRILFKAI